MSYEVVNTFKKQQSYVHKEKAMAGTLVKFKSSAFTNGSDGYITVASTVGFYETAKVQISASGTPGAGGLGVITEIVSSTVMGIRLNLTDPDGSARYGRSNVAAFNTVTQEPQLIYNPNDKPLT